jgi:hypothetical protein
LRNGFEERPPEQIVFGEDVALYCVRWRRVPLIRANRKKLALIIPLVDCRVGVEALIALQADQLGIQSVGESLADAGLAFQQQWSARDLW